MKRRDYRLGLVTAGLMGLSGLAEARGWTNWPAWQWQRHGKTQAEQCYSGVVERITVAPQAAAAYSPAAAPTMPTAPSWYRSQRTMLIDQKLRLKYVVPYYVDKGRTNSIDGWVWGSYPLWQYYRSSPVLPLYSVTGLCVQAGLPTNYFEYTPWRCLNGLGPQTNDATVGHRHGWTNATTAAGGTNYPAGRGCWYTTDYGWQGLKDCLDLLTWTYTTGQWTNRVTRSALPAGDAGMPNTVWNLAVTNWYASSWATNSKRGSYLCQWAWAYTNWGTGSADLYDVVRQKGAPFAGTCDAFYTMRAVPTNYACSVDLYGYAVACYVETVPSGPFYDQDGFGTTENTLGYLQSLGEGQTVLRVGAAMGYTDIPYAVNPATQKSVDWWGDTWGQEIASTVGILKFDGANGFRYLE